jgi:hypothetical protein
VRYLVRARVRPQQHEALLEAIESKSLGRGSVAEDEYLRNMRAARVDADGTVKWVEICYCTRPLDEERPYWERFFELSRVQDAHDRSRCRHENGTELWSCDSCDCSARLEAKLAKSDESFVAALRASATGRCIARRSPPPRT